MNKLLKAKNLVKEYGQFTAVDHVNFEIEEGELIALIGPNGAGKSTLFNLLIGEESPDGGKVRFKGEDITDTPPQDVVKKGIGFSFQIVNLFSSHTPYENLQIPGIADMDKTYDMVSRIEKIDELNEKVMSTLDSLKFSDPHQSEVENLPHGKKRLTDLGIPLTSSVKLLILDEPTAGLGSESVDRIKDLIEKLHEDGMTIFFSEHDLDMVYDTAQRILVLARGTLIADGPPSEVRNEDAVRDVYG